MLSIITGNFFFYVTGNAFILSLYAQLSIYFMDCNVYLVFFLCSYLLGENMKL